MPANFTTLYKHLNAKQKEAVDAIEGPVMVIAGPGTGKTQILTLRIANILKKTDTSPDSILALTFTESGVFSMRKRLVEMIGSDGYRVNIYTFHGFCNEVIKRFPDAFPRIIGANNINDIDKITILKEIILRLELKTLKPFGDNFYYIHPVRGKISELKRENISPEKLATIIAKQKNDYESIEDLMYETGAHKGKIKGKYRDIEKKIKKNEELLVIYHEYERALQKARYYDYDDMIVETIKALESDGDVLLELQEEFQYVLADEHQDANNAQNRLLELLTDFHDNPNLFIVGDEKQAIFRFQGASLDNFLYFKEKYKEATLVTLEDNYRSTQAILDSAHSLISKGEVVDEHLRVKLKSHHEGQVSPIEVTAFSNESFEHLALAMSIESRIQEGVPPEEIVVIYRNNRDAEALSHILEKTKIPFSIESDQSVLADVDIQKFILLLRATYFFGDDATLLPLLHVNFVHIDAHDVYRILRYSQKEKQSLYDVLSKKELLQKAGVADTKKLHELYLNLKTWKKVSENKGVLDTVQMIATESGFLEYLLGVPESVEKLEKLSGLFSDITTLIQNHKDHTFKDLIDYFNDVHEHNVLIRKDTKTRGVSSVRLMTAHKSKGLEFDYVYIIGAYDGHWGKKRSVVHFDILSMDDASRRSAAEGDERRLFYVALTRARVHASISYAREGQTGRQQLPTQYIEEIDEDLIREVDSTPIEKKLDTKILLRPGRKVVVPPINDKEFLNGVFIDQGLSVTALNNYLNCPWNYFYSNLLRVPKTPTKHLLFGTVVHAVLKDFFEKLKRGEVVSEKTMMKLFMEYVEQAAFTESELKEAIDKGEAAFPGYYKQYARHWNPETLNEFRISVLLPVDLARQEPNRALGELGQLKLRGDLDKMELEQNERDVNVVDYKTGKPKTRNHIEGKTKTSNGEYKRQLVFYKLLLELHDNGRYCMTGGDIDFIEPDEKGKYHKEHFEILDEEVDELKHEIERVSQEILNLDFWNTRCDNKDCEYCALRDKMEE